jgi:hypothetical protein
MQVMTSASKARRKEKIKAEEEPTTTIMVKTTWRMPKPLLKQLKQYGLDNAMTLQQIAMKAFNDLLKESSY